MGNTFYTQKLQHQYNVCDLCKTNIIKYNGCYLNKKINKGFVYFSCINNHNFFINAYGECYFNIIKQFNDINS